jgi:hypothetical protein
MPEQNSIYKSEASSGVLLQDVASRLRRWRSHRADHGREEAPEFSVFRFCLTDELGLSAIIAWMLNPKGDHEQGAAFLEAFIRIFGIEFADLRRLATAKVEAEVHTHEIEASRRRMDIEVNCGDYLVAIENKPYATFQRRQIADYCTHLHRRVGDKFSLIILKGWTGTIPITQRSLIPATSIRIVDSDYRAVQAWVRACAAQCAAASIKQFLHQFDAFIEAEFLTGMSKKEERLVLEAIEGQERMLAALDIIAAAHGLYLRLHKDLVEGVRARRKRGWVVHDQAKERAGKVQSSTYFLTIDFHSDLPVVFAFDMYDGFQHANFAVRERRCAKRPVRKLKRIQQALQEAYPRFGKAEGTWLWWANSSALADRSLIELQEHYVWKAAVEPQKLAECIVGFARQLEVTIRKAVRDG